MNVTQSDEDKGGVQTVPPLDELEAQLHNDLMHTLKLVPQSQRELFVFELAKYLSSRDQQIANAERQDLLFDLDEIDNKPWRVFRQLANIMPEYADTYNDYEAFYAFGGGIKIGELIEEFKKTDDYKQSYFVEKPVVLNSKQGKEL